MFRTSKFPYAGATEYSYTTIYMSSAAIETSVAFMGKDCMFDFTSGYVVKRYDGATDRTIITSNADLSVDPVSMKLGSGSIDTADYVLPINGSFTVNLESGSLKIGQDIALLPGAETQRLLLVMVLAHTSMMRTNGETTAG